MYLGSRIIKKKTKNHGIIVEKKCIYRKKTVLEFLFNKTLLNIFT